MAAKKRRVNKEPFLNVVARTLGGAAGTLTRTSKRLAEGLVEVPENITIKVQETVDSLIPAKRSSAGTQHGKKKGRRSTRSRRVAPRIAARKAREHGRSSTTADWAAVD